MNKPWSELPNSHHIDWVIKSVKENPLLWRAAWHEAPARSAARDVAWDAARDAAGASPAAADEALTAVRDAVVVAAATADEAWDVWEVILALVSYDDCDQYLNMSYEKLHVYAMLSEKPQAILLLPMVYVKEKLNEQALV